MEKTEIEKRQLTKDEIRNGKVSRGEFCKNEKKPYLPGPRQLEERP